jgi:HK97 family phage portal protein
MEIFGFPTLRSFLKRSNIDEEGFVGEAIASARSAGIRVTPDNAMQICTVFACIRARTESLAALPMMLYKRTSDGGREPDPEHPVSRIFKRANRWQSWQDFSEMLGWHLDLRGNALAEIIRTKGAAIAELIPLNPDLTLAKIDKQGELYYETRNEAGQTRILAPEDIFHIKIFSSDGINGTTAINHQRMLMETAMAQENYSASMFKNGTALSGVLKHPAKFKDKKAQDRVLDSWRKAYSGPRNAGKVAILEEGLTWEKISMTAVDAQFTDQVLRTSQRVCGVLRVPGHKVGDLTNAKYANIETQNIDFVTDSLVPYGERWQAEIWWKLLSEKEQVSYFAEILYYALLKGDQKSRNEALKIQREQGIISTNEWRRIENMNPLGDADGGGLRIVPINFQNIEFAKDRPVDNTATKTPTEPAKKAEGKTRPLNFERTEGRFLELFSEHFDVYLIKQQNSMRSAAKKGNLETALPQIRSEQKEFLTLRLAPAAQLFIDLAAREMQDRGENCIEPEFFDVESQKVVEKFAKFYSDRALENELSAKERAIYSQKLGKEFTAAVKAAAKKEVSQDAQIV